MTDIVWLPLQSIAPGEHRATVTNIQLTLGAVSGKPMFVWSFELEEGRTIDLYTSTSGAGARTGYECAKALGLSRSFSRSEVVGLPCRVEVAEKDGWTNVTKVLPA